MDVDNDILTVTGGDQIDCCGNDVRAVFAMLEKVEVPAGEAQSRISFVSMSITYVYRHLFPLYELKVRCRSPLSLRQTNCGNGTRVIQETGLLGRNDA